MMIIMVELPETRSSRACRVRMGVDVRIMFANNCVSCPVLSCLQENNVDKKTKRSSSSKRDGRKIPLSFTGTCHNLLLEMKEREHTSISFRGGTPLWFLVHREQTEHAVLCQHVRDLCTHPHETQAR